MGIQGSKGFGRIGKRTLARGMRVGVHRPVRILPEIGVDAVPTGAIRSHGGGRRRNRRRRSEDTRRRRGVGVEDDTIDGLADRAKLYAHVVDGGVHLGLPVAELAGRRLDALEAIVECVLHAIDALGDGGLEIRHGHGQTLDLVEDRLKMRIHSSARLAKPGEVLVMNFVGIQIGVSDTTMLATVNWRIRLGTARRGEIGIGEEQRQLEFLMSLLQDCSYPSSPLSRNTYKQLTYAHNTVILGWKP